MYKCDKHLLADNVQSCHLVNDVFNDFITALDKTVQCLNTA